MKKFFLTGCFFFMGLFLLFPLQTKALEQLKTCTYGNASKQLKVTIYNDYSADAKLSKFNGKSKNDKLTIINWSQLLNYIKATTKAKCPTYAVVDSKLMDVNFFNNKESASTLKTESSGTLLNLNKEVVIDNKRDIEEEIVSCKYQITNASGKHVSLVYDVFADGRVKLPFSDNFDYLANGKTWYHADQFANKFYRSSRLSATEYTCPNLVVQENELGATVYVNGNAKCIDKCYNITASSVTLSDSAKQKNIREKKVVSGCTGASVGLYKSKSYFFPYVRLYSDGTKAWSIDGENFVPISQKITGKVNKKPVEFIMNSSLVEHIFKGNSAICPTKIYRCVNKKGTGYNYELSTSAAACSKDELGSTDGQGFGSPYAGGAFGDPTDGDSPSEGELTLDDLEQDLAYGQPSDCNSILGSVGDKESVAWLLQQLLNYLKVLGPILVVILSSIDFAKAIVISDDDNMKKAQKKLVVRLCAAVALFLIPTLVQVLLDLFGITSAASCVLK